MKEGEKQNTLTDKLAKQVAKGAGVAFIGQMAGKAISLILQILLSRVLGVSVYGIYALGYTVLNISTQTSLLGLPSSVVRFGAIYHGEADRKRLRGLLLTAIVFVTASSLFGLALLFFLAKPLSLKIFNEPDLAEFLKIVAFALPFYALIHIFAASAQALRRIDYDVAIKEIMHPSAKFLIVGILFLMGAKLFGVAYALLIAAILAAVFGFHLVRKLFPELISKLSPIYELKRLVKFSVGVFFIGFSYLWLSQTDRVMLGYLSESKDVGIYNAAVSVARQTIVFLSAFNAIFAPVIADLYNRKMMDDFESLFKTTTKWIVTLTLPVCVGFIFFARPIMGLFGEEFTTGWGVLAVLTAAQFVNVSVGGVGYALVMTGHQWLELANGILLGGLNIVLNFYLIKHYGALGAGLATGFSIMAINLVRLGEIYRLFKIHPYKIEYYKPILACLIATGIGISFKYMGTISGWFWIVGLAGVLSVYAITTALLGLDSEDKIVWRAVKRRLVGHR